MDRYAWQKHSRVANLGDALPVFGDGDRPGSCDVGPERLPGRYILGADLEYSWARRQRQDIQILLLQFFAVHQFPAIRGNRIPSYLYAAVKRRGVAGSDTLDFQL